MRIILKYLCPVAPTPGSSQGSLWMLSVKLDINTVTTSSSAHIAPVSHNTKRLVSDKIPLDTFQLDTTRTFILLPKDRVAALVRENFLSKTFCFALATLSDTCLSLSQYSRYNSMTGSSVRAPSVTTLYWTYSCISPPTVSFGIIDATNIAQLLTLDQQDWYHGFGDIPGWCNGKSQFSVASFTS